MGKVKRFEIYVALTTTMTFTRVGESDLFEVICPYKRVLVREEDLIKLEVGKKFEIPIFYGVEWTIRGQERMTAKTFIASWDEPLIGEITTYES